MVTSEFQTRCSKMGLTPRQSGFILSRVYPNAHIEAHQLGLDALEFAESKAAQVSDLELQQIVTAAKEKYPEAFEC